MFVARLTACQAMLPKRRRSLAVRAAGMQISRQFSCSSAYCRAIQRWTVDKAREVDSEDWWTLLLLCPETCVNIRSATRMVWALDCESAPARCEFRSRVEQGASRVRISRLSRSQTEMMASVSLSASVSVSSFSERSSDARDTLVAVVMCRMHALPMAVVCKPGLAYLGSFARSLSHDFTEISLMDVCLVDFSDGIWWGRGFGKNRTF